MHHVFDVAVIGGGPGGYTAAIEAGKRGLDCALIEVGELGGICLNWGCMPVKALLQTAHRLEQIREAEQLGISGVEPDQVAIDWPRALERSQRVVHTLASDVSKLLLLHQVEVIRGFARPLGEGHIEVTSGANERRLIQARSTVLATGSWPDRDQVQRVSDKVLEVPDLFRLPTLPKQAAVWGDGAEAVELSLLLALCGVQTSLICRSTTLLPEFDLDLGAFASDRLARAGVRVYLDNRPQRCDQQGVVLRDGSYVLAEFILNAGPRVPVLGALADLPLVLERGFIRVDQHSRTSVDRIYAVGDITGKTMLAQGARLQAQQAVNHITGRQSPLDLEMVAATVFLSPEIATVGQSEQDLLADGVEYQRRLIPLRHNSQALLEGQTGGFVKILSEKDHGEVLGVHIVAPHASEMISEAVASIRFAFTAEEVAVLPRPHPAFAEAFQSHFADRSIHRS